MGDNSVLVCIALLKLFQNARNFIISPLNLSIINFGNFGLTIVLALTIEGGAGTNPESVTTRAGDVARLSISSCLDSVTITSRRHSPITITILVFVSSASRISTLIASVRLACKISSSSRFISLPTNLVSS